jgi:hypothetical protein
MTKAFYHSLLWMHRSLISSTVERNSLFRSELLVNTELDLTFLLAFREQSYFNDISFIFSCWWSDDKRGPLLASGRVGANARRLEGEQRIKILVAAKDSTE